MNTDSNHKLQQEKIQQARKTSDISAETIFNTYTIHSCLCTKFQLSTTCSSVTSVNSALHRSRVAKSSTSFAWGKGRNVTSARWQVTLCDPIWHRVPVAVRPVANCYNPFTFTFTDRTDTDLYTK